MPTYEELLKMGAKPGPAQSGLTYEALLAQGARPGLSTPQPKQPGFTTGLRESLGLPGSLTEAGQMLKGLGSTVVHPIQTAQALYEQQAEQFGKAGEAWQRGGVGGVTEAAGHALAGALPLLGPAAAKAGEDIGQGNIAYGLGQAAGLLTPFAAAEAVRYIRPTKTAATASSVRKTMGERMQSPGLMKAEGIAERTIPGTSPFQRFRTGQQMDLRALSDKLINNISEFKGSSEELGSRLQKSLETVKTQIKSSIGQEYADIDKAVASHRIRQQFTREIPSKLIGPSGESLTVPKTITKMVEAGGVRVSTDTLKKFARPLLRKIRQESKIIPPQELSRTNQILQRIADAPNEVSFSVFHDARSDLLSIARSYGDPIPGKAGGVAKKLAQLSTDAMESAARESNVPGLLQKVRGANTRWAQLVKDYDQTIVKRILDTAPEKATALLERAPLEDIRTVKRLSPQNFSEATARIIQKAIDDATVGELRAPVGLQRVEELAGTAKTPVLKAPTLRNILESRLGPERLQALLSPAHAKELYRVLAEAESLGVGTSNLVSGAVNGYLAFQGLQVLRSPSLVGLGNIAMTYVPVNLFSRLMIRQPKGWMSTIRNYARAAGQGNAAQVSFWSQRLGQFLAQEQQRSNKSAQTSPATATLGASNSASIATAPVVPAVAAESPFPALQQLMSGGAATAR